MKPTLPPGSPAAPLVATLLAAALALSPAATAAGKDTLTIGVAQFPANMHPYIGSQTVQQYVVGIGLHRLTTLDHTGQVVCLLCTEVPSLDNGGARLVDRPDGNGGTQQGLDVTFHIRPGLRWADGAPVTARDVAFTGTVGRDPNAGFSNPHPWTRATAIDVVDDRTVVMHLPRTLTTFALWDEILSEHVEGPIYEAAKGPGDYVNRTAYNREPTNPGLWNGPFAVAEYQSNVHVLFRPNPSWPGTKPGLAAIDVKLVENTAALQANMLSGDVDLAPSGIGLSIDQAVALEKADNGRFRFIYKPQLNYEHIEPNFSNPALADKRVREALLRGIDVPSIVNRLFAGHAEVARTFINGADRHFTPDVPTYPFDPPRARALLEEAGWTPGPDGIRRNKAGDRLSLDFSTTAGNRVRELTQQVMQNQWKAVGVEVRIANQPSRTFFGPLLRQRQFTGLAEFASTGEPDLPPIRWTTPYIPTEANNFGGQNYGGVSVKAFDDAVEASQYELDPAKQQALWATAQRVYAAELMSLPLYFREDPDVIPTWLDGYVATGKENYVTYWSADWKPKP